MLPNIYQTGNTVRLTCRFEKEEEDGQRVRINPDSVSIRIMNYKYEILETIPLDASNIKDVGVWFYDYITPAEPTLIIYEFVSILENEMFNKRRSIKTSFL